MRSREGKKGVDAGNKAKKLRAGGEKNRTKQGNHCERSVAGVGIIELFFLRLKHVHRRHVTSRRLEISASRGHFKIRRASLSCRRGSLESAGSRIGKNQKKRRKKEKKEEKEFRGRRHEIGSLIKEAKRNRLPTNRFETAFSS